MVALIVIMLRILVVQVDFVLLQDLESDLVLVYPRKVVGMIVVQDLIMRFLVFPGGSFEEMQIVEAALLVNSIK